MSHLTRTTLLALSLSLALAACKPATDAAQPAAENTASTPTIAGLDTEKKKVSYMVGLDLARTIKPVQDEVDIDTVVQALRSAHADERPLLDEAQANTIRSAFSQHLREKREAEHKQLAAKNQQAADAFFATNAKQTGVQSTASGLQYQVIKPSTGAKPAATATVRVHYIGATLDGKEFDNTYKRDHDANLALGNVLPGWREGVTLMPVGSKYKFWIPAKLAYGEFGKPGEIEPNAPLVFEVELLEIAK